MAPLEQIWVVLQQRVDVAVDLDADFLLDLDVEVDHDRLVRRFDLYGGRAATDGDHTGAQEEWQHAHGVSLGWGHSRASIAGHSVALGWWQAGYSPPTLCAEPRPACRRGLG